MGNFRKLGWLFQQTGKFAVLPRYGLYPNIYLHRHAVAYCFWPDDCAWRKCAKREGKGTCNFCVSPTYDSHTANRLFNIILDDR